MLNLNNNYTELIKPKNNRSEKAKLNFLNGNHIQFDLIT